MPFEFLRESHCRSSAGREFQTRGRAAAKHQSPLMFHLCRTAHVNEFDERSRRGRASETS